MVLQGRSWPVYRPVEGRVVPLEDDEGRFARESTGRTEMNDNQPVDDGSGVVVARKAPNVERFTSSQVPL